MHVEVPAEIGLDGFVQDVNHIGAAHSHVVLETILADILHQLLQVIDLRHGDAAVHAIGIVGNLTLAQVSLDTALRVVCRDAEEGEGTLRNLGIDSTEGIDFAQRSAQHAEGTEFKVTIAYKLLGEVAAVGAHTLSAPGSP